MVNAKAILIPPTGRADAQASPDWRDDADDDEEVEESAVEAEAKREL